MAFREHVAAFGTARAARRLDVRLKASLRETGCSKFTIDVKDLSVTGCRIETSFTLTPGTSVWITIPGLAALEAEVAWAKGFSYGCRFYQSLHIAVLDHIIAHYGSRSG
jgi:hypothetical protein